MKVHPFLWGAACALVVASCGTFKDGGDDDHDGEAPDGEAARHDAGGGSGGGSGSSSGGYGLRDAGAESSTAQDSSVAVDSSVAQDSGTVVDSSAPVDSGATADSSAARDSGATADSSTAQDSSATADSGTVADGGALTCQTTGSADRRFPQWRLPPVGPPLSNYDVGTDTVLDHTTGLVWERNPPGKAYSWADVNTRCAALRAGGGATDWRVPTRAELLTILDYTQLEGTFLGTQIYGVTVASQGDGLWTSSMLDLTAPVSVGSFDLDTYFSWTTIVLTNDVSDFSLCVRSGCVSPASPRFVVSSDAALDATTGLTWQRSMSAGNLSPAGAQTYCSGLSAGGISAGWRVPNIRELESIFDETVHVFPMWDTTTFQTAAGVGNELWSSTPVAGAAQLYTLDFADGAHFDFVREESTTASVVLPVRCVHD